MAESSPKVLKTLWEKEKLLVTSNFSFSLSVFKILLFPTVFSPFPTVFSKYFYFPQCFQNTFIADTYKPGLVWERDKNGLSC